MYVIDTDALSLTNAATGYFAPDVDAWRIWARANTDDLYLSVMTIMEVRYGIEKLRAKGATKKAGDLTRWLASAETIYRGRTISVSIEIAHRAGELLHSAVASGMAPSSEDAIIAATADVRGFAVLSRNAKDMQALKVAWINPLTTIPPKRAF